MPHAQPVAGGASCVSFCHYSPSSRSMPPEAESYCPASALCAALVPRRCDRPVARELLACQFLSAPVLGIASDRLGRKERLASLRLYAGAISRRPWLDARDCALALRSVPVSESRSVANHASAHDRCRTSPDRFRRPRNVQRGSVGPSATTPGEAPPAGVAVVETAPATKMIIAIATSAAFVT